MTSTLFTRLPISNYLFTCLYIYITRLANTITICNYYKIELAIAN